MKTFLIVGLGNPGPEYEATRHNVGFMVLDRLAAKLLPVKKSQFRQQKKLKSLIIKEKNFILAKPQLFMNEQGEAVRKIKDYFHLDSSQILVVHDDLDLPLGEVRVVVGRGAAGHRGVASIIDFLGNNNFSRVRVGIGRPVKEGILKHEGDSSAQIVRYVLSPFREEEKVKIRKVIKKTARLIAGALEKGILPAPGKHHF